MTAKKTTSRTPRQKTEPTPTAPQNQPQEPTQPTEHDYDVDAGAVLELLGVPAGLVKQNTTHLQFVDGKLIIEYTVIRAIPPRIMGMALMRGATPQEETNG